MALFFYAQKNKENYKSVVGCGELHYATQEIMIFLRNWKKTGEGLAGHHGMAEHSVGTTEEAKHLQRSEEGERAFCEEAEFQTKAWIVGKIKESMKCERKDIFESTGGSSCCDGEAADTLP